MPASSKHRGSSGSPVGLLVGIAVVVLLAGGAGYLAWRRFRRAQA
ncbi:MAG: LPXTG cell wall anchor domain-containing protein [Acidimicrobiaceae bacterium]|nr:LPXTG cell wall anchor domain-containing protein [Acidimicrobiaceae bacterium]